MAGTEAWTGALLTEDADDFDTALDMASGVATLGSHGIGRFANTTDRDTAAAALGGAVNGLHCSVDGIDQVYNDSGWRVVMQTRYAIVTRTANSAITTGSSSATAISWNTTEQNSGSGGTGTSGITIPLTGLYRISGTASFEANSTGVRHCELQVNGSPVTGLADNRAAVPGFTSPVSIGASRVFTVNDVVTLAVWQTSGGTINVVYARLSLEYAGG